MAQNVKYGIQDHGEPPPVTRTAGGGRSSPFDDLLNEVMEKHPGTWKVVAEYGVSNSASSAATQLRKQYGNKAEVSGWEFRTGKLRNDSYGLWVKYDGEKVIDGALEAWEQEKKARAEAWAAARDAKEKAEKPKGLKAS